MMMEIDSSPVGPGAADKSVELLECLEDLVQVERRLTLSLESAAKILPTRFTAGRRAPTTTSSDGGTENQEHSFSKGGLYVPGSRPLPTPSTMEEAEQVLALSRTLASRTSAPSGWNPMLPVVTFATPNPLPHQVRGGALAAMQLNMAKKERSAGKGTKRAADDIAAEGEEEAQRRKSEAAEAAAAAAAGALPPKPGESSSDPTKSDGQLDEEMAQRRKAEEERRRRKAVEAKKRKAEASMLLDSDSSSEEEDDDDEEE